MRRQRDPGARDDGRAAHQQQETHPPTNSRPHLALLLRRRPLVKYLRLREKFLGLGERRSQIQLADERAPAAAALAVATSVGDEDQPQLAGRAEGSDVEVR